jgi:RNA polymerase sigma factor (sigma-70 family)
MSPILPEVHEVHESTILAEFEPIVMACARSFIQQFLYEWEDILQEARLSALLAIRSFDPAHNCSLKTWVGLEIMHGLERWRHGKVLVRAGGRIDFCPYDEVSYRVGDKDHGNHVAARIDAKILMNRLQGRDKQIIQDLYWGEMPWGECAQKHGVTEGRIGQVHKRAIKAMSAAA